MRSCPAVSFVAVVDLIELFLEIRRKFAESNEHSHLYPVVILTAQTYHFCFQTQKSQNKEPSPHSAHSQMLRVINARRHYPLKGKWGIFSLRFVNLDACYADTSLSGGRQPVLIKHPHQIAASHKEILISLRNIYPCRTQWPKSPPSRSGTHFLDDVHSHVSFPKQKESRYVRICFPCSTHRLSSMSAIFVGKKLPLFSWK